MQNVFCIIIRIQSVHYLHGKDLCESQKKSKSLLAMNIMHKQPLCHCEKVFLFLSDLQAGQVGEAQLQLVFLFEVLQSCVSPGSGGTCESEGVGEGIKSTEAQVYILVDNVGHIHTDMQSTGNNAVLGRGGGGGVLGYQERFASGSIPSKLPPMVT